MALVQLGNILQGQLAFGGHLVDDEGNHKGGGIARNPNKHAAFKSDLEQRTAYALSLAKTAEQEAAIMAAHDDELAHGAGFTRQRKGSDFSPPPVITADRNELARILFQFKAIAHGMGRADREAARKEGRPKMTRTIAKSCLPVLEALIALAKKHGKVFPSLEGIAAMVDYHRATVVEALKTIEQFGFITVTRRLKRIRTPLGFKTVQDTNAYSIHAPTKGWGAFAVQLFKGFSGSENPRAIKNHSVKEPFLKRQSLQNSPPPLPDDEVWRRQNAEGGVFSHC